MAKKIYFDGLNLALRRGTGITTYSRVLIQLARDLGHQTGILYNSQRSPARDAQMREVDFFDDPRLYQSSKLEKRVAFVVDHFKNRFGARPIRLDLQGIVLASALAEKLVPADHYFLSRYIFGYADFRFKVTDTFLPVHFDVAPDIMHCTYQMPIAAKSACKIWTIHDLVSLRLPYASLDDKRRAFRLLRKIGTKADHIVTVSENSRRDIIKYLGVEPSRVTNTYQSVTFPHSEVDRKEADVAEELSGSFCLDVRGYFLFFGALEPKKNVGRLLDAYLESGVEIPLVLVTGQGWSNEQESKAIDAQMAREQENRRRGRQPKRRVIRFEYVTRSMLVTLIRGARAVLFPSLYEGFGLPVLEAMVLGTPVVTANCASLPEVAGDAALLVNPYDTKAIAKAIQAIAMDTDLCTDLAARGLLQAEKFSLDLYRKRISALYDSLG